MRYTKPHLTFGEQIQRLEDRELIIDDRNHALIDLERIGYYRLSAYWYQWRVRPADHNEGIDIPLEDFIGGHSFEEAVALYTFDRQLRLIILDAIERLEVSTRVEIAYVVGRRDPLAHLLPLHLGTGCGGKRPGAEVSNFVAFLERQSAALESSSERFAEHFRTRYEGEVPIWVAIELWDFGMLSSFFQLLCQEDQEEVAKAFNIPRYKMLTSWLVSLNYLRNLCAHHSRLYRRGLVNKPGTKDLRFIPDLKHIRALEDRQLTKLYPALAVMAYLMRRAASDSRWMQRIRDHLLSFPVIDGSGLQDYGFPENWHEEALWSMR